MYSANTRAMQHQGCCDHSQRIKLGDHLVHSGTCATLTRLGKRSLQTVSATLQGKEAAFRVSMLPPKAAVFITQAFVLQFCSRMCQQEQHSGHGTWCGTQQVYCEWSSLIQCNRRSCTDKHSVHGRRVVRSLAVAPGPYRLLRMRFVVPGAASSASAAPPIATMTALPGVDSSSTIVSHLTSHMPCIRQNSRTTGVMKFKDIVPAANVHAALVVQCLVTHAVVHAYIET